MYSPPTSRLPCYVQKCSNASFQICPTMSCLPRCSFIQGCHSKNAIGNFNMLIDLPYLAYIDNGQDVLDERKGDLHKLLWLRMFETCLSSLTSSKLRRGGCRLPCPQLLHTMTRTSQRSYPMVRHRRSNMNTGVLYFAKTKLDVPGPSLPSGPATSTSSTRLGGEHGFSVVHSILLRPECPICLSMFASTMSAAQHLRNSSKRGYCVPDRACLQQSRNNDDIDDELECPYCLQLFINVLDHYEHALEHFDLKCYVCDVLYPSRNTYTEHKCVVDANTAVAVAVSVVTPPIDVINIHCSGVGIGNGGPPGGGGGSSSHTVQTSVATDCPDISQPRLIRLPQREVSRYDVLGDAALHQTRSIAAQPPPWSSTAAKSQRRRSADREHGRYSQLDLRAARQEERASGREIWSSALLIDHSSHSQTRSVAQPRASHLEVHPSPLPATTGEGELPLLRRQGSYDSLQCGDSEAHANTASSSSAPAFASVECVPGSVQSAARGRPACRRRRETGGHSLRRDRSSSHDTHTASGGRRQDHQTTSAGAGQTNLRRTLHEVLGPRAVQDRTVCARSYNSSNSHGRHP